MVYEFTKKELRNVGATVIGCGSHSAIIYKQLGEWKYRVGFAPTVGEFIPVNQYAYGSALTKRAAIVQAEAEIVGYGENGDDWTNATIEYVKG